ncbi:MAG TPA: glycosyltransferase family 2 protein, partial [Anaerolineae bacterium]|nr:glycosyltransferase family 2 protein [Anaerolineae bacterium]
MNKQAVAALDLGIVIVSYNVQALLRRCLQSIYDSIGDVSFAVCVVDNNSPDDSAAMVKAQFPQVHLIANADNPGYSTANNQGIHWLNSAFDAPPRYILLLNPDTEVMPNTFCDSVRYMEQNLKVGIMGPKLLLPDGHLDLACRRSFPSPMVSFYRMTGLSKLFPDSKKFGRYNMTYLDEDQLTEVDSVVGAFMLVRQAAIRQVGLLDEQFWMYGEDLDWAKRIKDHGWKVIYNPRILTLH